MKGRGKKRLRSRKKGNMMKRMTIVVVMKRMKGVI
jgi:hypothetical protein